MPVVPCTEEATGDDNLAMEVARDADSAPGDRPLDACCEGELGTALGLAGDEVCF